ncbi:Protein of unknown function [Micromonospora coriariae]|uniref:Outer membrane lipoprotein-sorting protein n=1 Tax=Micromonospora coriariae TaxID=285665 RepID=A0A1C4V398_9ACTN|nr:LppX_LprAFG lipoprotein [Micromonospora coriariae]SCE78560.1 Protein of unknown function [Micromonospora coriariae]
MNKPKLVAAGAVLAVAIAAGVWALAVGGDEPDAGRPAAGASPAPAATDPVSVLVAAAAKIDQQTYKLTVGAGGEAGGDGTVVLWDPKARRGLETTSLKVPTGEVKIERLTTGPDVYVRVTAPDRRVPVWDGRTWWHVGAEGSPAAKQGLDNTRLAGTLTAPAQVRQTGVREYAGTLDLRASGAVLGSGVGAVLGDRAAAVPFTATVDEQGRLVRYRIELASEQSQTAQLDLTYSDFGQPVTAEPPAADLVGEDPPANIPGA